MSPELRTLLVGDDPEAWMSAGFTVDGDEVRVGAVRIRLTGSGGRRGLHGWSMSEVGEGSIDGLATSGSELEPAVGARHANGVTRVDHVVAMTPDLDRTTAALVAAGFDPRRRREVPDSDPPRAQVFFWAGEAILELVGPTVPCGSGPARLWGLALTCQDLEAAADALGDRLAPPKPAVQEGRRIATLRTGPLGVSVPIALMSPHVTAP